MQTKVVLLTGGARGIGAAMAAAFAAAGAKVMLSDVLKDAGRATAEAIRSAGGEADFVEHDVRAEPAWQAAIAATISSLRHLDHCGQQCRDRGLGTDCRIVDQ